MKTTDKTPLPEPCGLGHADETELRIARVAFESQCGLMVTDAAGVILRVNAAFTRMSGYSAAEAVGQTPALLKSGRQDPRFYQTLWRSLLNTLSWQGEIWNRAKNGRVHAAHLHITAVTNAAGVVSHYVANFTDISLAKDAETLVHRLAYYDGLTHLPNRRLLRDRLEYALLSCARSGLCGAVFFIDVDNFRALNDTDGHEVGDQLLVQLATRLRAAVRDGDTVARQGGDEFVLLLEDLSASAELAATLASQLGDKLRAAMKAPVFLAGRDYQCRLSIGVAVFQHGDTFESLMMHADLALQQAKNAGRNSLRFFDPTMQAALELRSALEAELQKAMPWNQLRLHYQPQVDRERRVVGVEALLRWQHPLRGLVPPGDFIPLAEDSGLILPIGAWVLEQACTQLRLWADCAAMRELQVAVNVSARQFAQPNFVAQVQAALAFSGVNPARLKLELTESLVLDNVLDAIGKMRAIKCLGVSFSMDDFGTGYSSLAYLAQLPIDQLKIDRSFVQNIPGKSSDETIARTIISMGRGLEMEVIAEGVETEAQRAFLARHGCDAYQGYLFSRPLPAQELQAYVDQA
jgi:diguanylate cyclase (GGDEF)-like protein/PAS domain S-box-containing protein